MICRSCLGVKMSEAMTSYPRYVVKLKLVDVSGRWNNDSFKVLLVCLVGLMISYGNPLPWTIGCDSISRVSCGPFQLIYHEYQTFQTAFLRSELHLIWICWSFNVGGVVFWATVGCLKMGDPVKVCEDSLNFHIFFRSRKWTSKNL